jgi:hypothetical protein
MQTGLWQVGQAEVSGTIVFYFDDFRRASRLLGKKPRPPQECLHED